MSCFITECYNFCKVASIQISEGTLLTTMSWLKV